MKQLFPEIQAQCIRLSDRFGTIPEERKKQLERLSGFITDQLKQQKDVQLVYVCTHNSRRSHFGQIWAAVAASFYDVSGVQTHSCGTETTAFHPNAIAALKQSGFRITILEEGINPVYAVAFGPEGIATCYSKRFDDPSLPKSGFVAVMTCGDADVNCPVLPGTALRIGTTYEDPKLFDGTSQQDAAYSERSDQIATECLYVFAQVKSALTVLK